MICYKALGRVFVIAARLQGAGKACQGPVQRLVPAAGECCGRWLLPGGRGLIGVERRPAIPGSDGQARDLTDSQTFDGLGSEEAIHPLDDLRRAMLQLQCGPGQAGHLQGADLFAGPPFAPQLQRLAECRQLCADGLVPIQQKSRLQGRPLVEQRLDQGAQSGAERTQAPAGLATFLRFVVWTLGDDAAPRYVSCKSSPKRQESFLPDMDSSALRQALLAWYDANRRDLPWRNRVSQRPDPYRVWLSEIMLQQTTTTTAGPYYQRFLDRFPGVFALAAAEQDEVLRLWAGLGYYARARNLHACAQRLARDFDGRFPEEEAALRSLPGIGDYTAAAIAAIAFDRPAAPVDGNWERVLARLFDRHEPLPKAKPILRALAQQLLGPERSGDFAQAMMDLGATVCVPDRPRCLLCPLKDLCRARAKGSAELLPVKAAKKQKPDRHGIAFLARAEDGAVLLRRRPQKGLLGGMMEVPGTPWRDKPWSESEALSHAPGPADWRGLDGRVTHVFTHFRLTLSVWTACPDREAWPLAAGSDWVERRELDGEALPSVMRKVVRHATKA